MNPVSHASSTSTGQRVLHLLAAAAVALALAIGMLAVADQLTAPPAAQAAPPQTLTYTCPAYPMQPMPWNSTCSFPRFNSALGTLSGVMFTTTANLSGTVIFENTSITSTTTFSWILTSTTNISNGLGTANVSASGSNLFTAWDGLTDFGGTSGRTYNFLNTQTSAFTATAAGTLASFTGSGNITIPIASTSSPFAPSITPAVNNINGVSALGSSALITVTYIYVLPDVSITKTAPANFVVGQIGTYTITVANLGPGPTIGTITVTENLPAGLTYSSFSGTGWSRTGTGPVITFTRASALAAGASSNIVLNTNVTNSAIGVITNTVSVTTTRDIDLPNNAASITTTVRPASNVSITKADGPDPVNANGTLIYTLTVGNAGPSIAPLVTVTDTLPAGVAYAGSLGAGWTITQTGQLITATRTNYAIGASSNILITTTAPSNGGAIVNTAGVTTTAVDTSTVNNLASATTTVSALADLSLSKSASVGTVNASTNFSYTLSVNNAGPSLAASVTVTDALPAGVTLVSAAGSGWSCSGVTTITCTRTNLGVGAAPDIVITVTSPSEGGLIINNAGVSTTAIDTNSANNLGSASVNVTSVADLSLVKSSSHAAIRMGAAMTYTLAVTNGGPSTASNVTVTDTLPAGVAYVTSSGAGWTITQAGQLFTATRASLAPGAAPLIVINVTAPGAPTTITNTAGVAATTLDLVNGNNTSSAATTVVPLVADLTISKSASPATVDALGTLTYTLSVSNGGPDTASAITVTDSLPAGVVLNTINAGGWSCSGATTVTCTLASLAVESAPAIELVTTAPANGGAITNTASVASATPEVAPADNTASAVATVNAVSDLALSKSASVGTVNAGANFSYTLSVNNAGPSLAPSVTVTDALPAGVTYVGAGGTGWLCSGTTTVTCSRTNLAVGAAPNIVITVTAPAEGGTILNNAGVSTTASDPDLGDNLASASVTVTAVANLALTKTDSPDPVRAGATLTYTLRVTNTGPSTAASVTLTDTLPGAATFLGVSGPGWDSCNEAAGAVTCSLATLPVGAAPVVTITVTAPNDVTTLNNSAGVASAVLDTNLSNNVAAASTTVTAVSDLAVTKTASPNPVQVGNPLTFTIFVTNAGPSVATNVRVTDTLPAGLTFGGVSGPGWTSCGRSGVTVTCTVASLAVGAAPNIIITATAPVTSGTIINNVVVGSSAFDPNAANNSDAESVSVTPFNDLSISKTNNQTSIVPGTTVTYSIVVNNPGPVVVNGAGVNDTMPAALTSPAWTCAATAGSSCPASGSGSISATVNLAIGGNVTFTVTSPVSATATGTLANTATVTLPLGITDPDTSNNTATDSDPLTPQADLQISKTDGQTSVTAGSTVNYTILVTNNGPSAALGATVSDSFPALLSGVTWTCTATPGSACVTGGSGDIATSVDLAPGGSATFSASGTLANDATGSLSNTATVTAPAGVTDANTANNSATDTDTIIALADLSITKTDGQTSAVAGSAITYTIMVVNNGPTAVTGAVVSDTFSASLTGMTWTCVASGGSTCAASGAGSLNTTVDLAVGGTATFIATGQIAPGASGSLVNTAAVSAPSGWLDPNTGNNSATDTDTLTVQADLAVTLTYFPDPAAGRLLRYRVTVTNTGPSNASGVTLTDVLPGFVAYDSDTGGCSVAAGAVTCDLGVIASGSSKTINIYVVPEAGGLISNTVSVTGNEADPSAANNTATVTTTATATLDLSISKTDGQTSVIAGEAVTYTIVVANNGAYAALDAVVSDTMPAALTSMTWTCAASSGSSCPASGSGSLSTNVTLAAGGSATFTVVGQVSAGASGTLSNTAAVTAPTGVTDSSAGNNSATDEDAITQVPVSGGYFIYLPVIMR
jgi:uncharacterized repeat protein (TIGR01451 family)